MLTNSIFVLVSVALYRIPIMHAHKICSSCSYFLFIFLVFAFIHGTLIINQANRYIHASTRAHAHTRTIIRYVCYRYMYYYYACTLLVAFLKEFCFLFWIERTVLFSVYVFFDVCWTGRKPNKPPVKGQIRKPQNRSFVPFVHYSIIWLYRGVKILKF